MIILRDKIFLRTKKSILSNLNEINELKILKPEGGLLFTYKDILGKTEIKKNEICFCWSREERLRTLYALEIKILLKEDTQFHVEI